MGRVPEEKNNKFQGRGGPRNGFAGGIVNRGGGRPGRRKKRKITRVLLREKKRKTAYTCGGLGNGHQKDSKGTQKKEPGKTNGSFFQKEGVKKSDQGCTTDQKKRGYSSHSKSKGRERGNKRKKSGLDHKCKCLTLPRGKSLPILRVVAEHRGEKSRRP